MHPTFLFDRYLLQKQVLALSGILRLFSPDGKLVLYSHQKLLRIIEDIHAFDNEGKQNEILYIQARCILDFSVAYDVYDSNSNEKIGCLHRKGFNSLFRDEWVILDATDKPIGQLFEDNLTSAILRRFFFRKWLPDNYALTINNQLIADFIQRFNLLRYEMDIIFSKDPEHQFDRRLGIAAAILLGTIEGHQN